MESLRSFVSYSGGKIIKDTKSRKRSLEESTERATGEDFSEVSPAASNRTEDDTFEDDGAGNLFEVGLSIAYCINLEYI